MDNNILVLIFGMAAVTYLTRFTFLFLFRHLSVPAPLARGFRFVPIGILAAIIVPGIVMPEGAVFLHWQNIYLIAGIASAAAALRWKNMFASLGTGIAIFLLLNTILPK